MNELRELIKVIFLTHPQTSPLKVIGFIEDNFEVEPGVVAGVILLLREEGELVVSGEDENGVLLSAKI